MKTSMERLSSGLRINSAKDDAAGLAISNRMTSQIRGLNQAARNANDGISLAQTAEGAMQESTNILQRIRDLAVQSANATNTVSDRASMQAEVSQLVQEMNRISNNTEFNGRKLLDGSFLAQNFQVGSNSGEIVDVSIGNISPHNLGSPSEELTGEYEIESDVWDVDGQSVWDDVSSINLTHLTVNDSFVISGPNGSANIVVDSNDSTYDVIEKINGASSDTGVSASGETFAYLGHVQVTNDPIADVTGPLHVDISIRGKETVSISVDLQKEVNGWGETHWSLEPLVDEINANSDLLGISGTFNDYNLYAYLESSEGYNITVGEMVMTDGDGVIHNYSFSDRSRIQLRKIMEGSNTGEYSVPIRAGSLSAATVEGIIKFKALGDFTITPGSTGPDFSHNNVFWLDTLYDAESNGEQGLIYGINSVEEIDISTQQGAQEAISIVDDAISQIDGERANLGAIQNRFESTISNLHNISENLSAARSRILDADIAAETSSLTKHNILQQAGISILSQANQQPQLALSLIGGV